MKKLLILLAVLFTISGCAGLVSIEGGSENSRVRVGYYNNHYGDPYYGYRSYYGGHHYSYRYRYTYRRHYYGRRSMHSGFRRHH